MHGGAAAAELVDRGEGAGGERGGHEAGSVRQHDAELSVTAVT